jgi:hypothetical protein
MTCCWKDRDDLLGMLLFYSYFLEWIVLYSGFLLETEWARAKILDRFLLSWVTYTGMNDCNPTMMQYVSRLNLRKSITNPTIRQFVWFSIFDQELEVYCSKYSFWSLLYCLVSFFICNSIIITHWIETFILRYLNQKTRST